MAPIPVEPVNPPWWVFVVGWLVVKGVPRVLERVVPAVVYRLEARLVALRYRE